jgi:CubicO group peptidase (beta-lactamase class C family)
LISKADEADRVGVMTSRVATDMVYHEIFRGKLDNLPGKVAKYSDVGFILLGHALEVLSGGQTLDRLAIQRIFSPLELTGTGFVELSKLKRGGLEPISEQIVPTVDCPWRRRILCGEVHDDNAWAMGGVAAHAGVFSNAIDIHTFATELIDCWHGRGDLVSKDVVRRFWQRDDTVPGSTWALGWDTPSEGESSSGHFFSNSSVGHLGFTGCSLWIDPEREVNVVLLSNRVHPNPDNILIKKFRPIIHDLVMSALGYGQ